MVMFYSATTNGFYPEDMRSMYDAAGTWPDDATEISDEEYTALMDGQAAGQEITPGDDGMPGLTTPVIDPAVIFGTQKEALQMETERVIATLERAVKYGMATEDETASLEAWGKYSVLVNRVRPGDSWPVKPS